MYQRFTDRDTRRAIRSAGFQSHKTFSSGKRPGYAGYLSSQEAVPVPLKHGPSERDEDGNRERSDRRQDMSGVEGTAPVSEYGAKISSPLNTETSRSPKRSLRNKTIKQRPFLGLSSYKVSYTPREEDADGESVPVMDKTGLGYGERGHTPSLNLAVPTRPALSNHRLNGRPIPSTTETTYNRSYDRSTTQALVPQLNLTNGSTNRSLLGGRVSTAPSVSSLGSQSARTEPVSRPTTTTRTPLTARLSTARIGREPWHEETGRSVYQDNFISDPALEPKKPDDVSKLATSRSLFLGTPKSVDHITGYSGFIPETQRNKTAVEHGFGRNTRNTKDFLLFTLKQMPRWKVGFAGYQPQDPKNCARNPEPPTETTAADSSNWARDPTILQNLREDRQTGEHHPITNSTIQFFQQNPGSGDDQVADAALYYHSLRPLEGVPRIDVPSITTAHGYRFNKYRDQV